MARDISQQPLAPALPKDNIFYSVSPAEQTPFSTYSFDLITVAQAYRWLNGEAFYKKPVG